jgi:hypothetical protein
MESPADIQVGIATPRPPEEGGLHHRYDYDYDYDYNYNDANDHNRAGVS